MDQPAYQISGGQDVPPPPGDGPEPPAADPASFAPPPEPAPFAPAEDVPEGKAAVRTMNALSAKVGMLSERIKVQEAATARMHASVERLESTVGEITKRTQPMLETLSAELARQGAMLESLRTETESATDLNTQRVNEFEQRLASVLREMREVVAGKIESFDLAVSDRLEEARSTVADQLASFQDQVRELVYRFANQAIPEDMRQTIDELSSRFVYAETALAATRSSVEFLRSEVGSLTMIVRKLSPGGNPQ